MLPDPTPMLLAKDRESLHALAVRWFAESLAVPRAMLVATRGLRNDFRVVGDTGGPMPDCVRFDDAATWSPISKAWPTRSLPVPRAMRDWLTAQGYVGVVVAQLAGRRGEAGALVGFTDARWRCTSVNGCPEALVTRAERCAVLVGIAIDRLHDADALERERTLQHLVALADEDRPIEALLKRALDVVLRHPGLNVDRRGLVFLRERTGELRLVAHAGDTSAPRTCRTVHPGSCLCGRVANSGHAIVSQHVGSEHDQALADEPDHGHVVLPLRSRSSVEGVLTLYTLPGVVLPMPTLTNLEFVANAIGQLIERVRLRAKVAEQALAFRALLDHAPIGAGVHREGRFVYANDAMARTLGYGSGADLAGLEVLALVHEDDRPFAREREARRVQSGAPSALAELRVAPPNGTVLYVETSSVPVVFEGEPSTFLMAQDVTERRSAQMRRALEERLASIGQLAAMIGHDINNPLTYVRSNLEFALNAVDGSPDATREALGDALKGAEFIGQITTDLRTFVRDQRLDGSQVTGLADVVTFVTRMAAARFRSSVAVVAQIPDDITVLADPTRLAQVVMGVVLDAAHAVDGSTNTRIEVRAYKAANRAVIEIEDWGPGRSPAQIAQAFDPCATTNAHGAGLGLHITRTIVQELHGTIELRSVPGQGSVVCVTLPLAADVVVAPAPSVERAHEQRYHVLLIDDDELVLRSMYRMLKQHMDVDMVTGGAAGLERLATTRYDLVLCDMMMPDVSGADLYAALRERRDLAALQALVFMTGGVFTPAMSSFLDANTCPVWFKPVYADAVLAELHRRSAAPERASED